MEEGDHAQDCGRGREQVKYIGDENWGNLKEKIENGPKKVKTFMVYLNVKSDIWILSWTTS